MVESKLVELVVAGSSPVGHPKNFSSQLLVWPASGIPFHTLQSVNFGQAIIGRPPNPKSESRNPNARISRTHPKNPRGKFSYFAKCGILPSRFAVWSSV